MELPDDIYDQVTELSETGNEHADEGEFAEAVAVWRQALTLLPEPQHQWEAWVWLQASVGDGLYQLGDYPGAKEALYDALKNLDAHGSPFVHYMLGKTLLKLDDGKGVDELLKAYMQEGEEIFLSDEDEGEAALQALRDRKLID